MLQKNDLQHNFSRKELKNVKKFYDHSVLVICILDLSYFIYFFFSSKYWISSYITKYIHKKINDDTNRKQKRPRISAVP